MTLRSWDLYVDGGWQASGSERLEVTYPFNGSVFADVPHASEDEVDQAVNAAREAALTMRCLPLHRRAEILELAAEGIETSKDQLNELMTLETGRPIKEIRQDTLRAASVLRQSADAARALAGEMIPAGGVPRDSGRLAFTVPEPLGVVAAITGFNFPLVLAAHKIGPAFAAGNTVVLKPAEKAPVSSLVLAEILTSAGLPAGALNVVTGLGPTTGQALASHAGVNYVAFTGSSAAGQKVARAASGKKVHLELGSNSPNIVHHDADLDLAVDKLVAGAYGASGQSCISVQRIYVHSDVFDAFCEGFVPAVKALKAGDPFDEQTDVSALIEPEATQRVLDFIEQAVAAGAGLLTGGQLQDGIIQPAVLTGVPADQPLSCEEAFGPVAIVEPYSDLDEAILAANNSRFGLQTGLFTSSIDTALYAASRLETAGVQVNEVSDFRLDQQPYGGIKESGHGWEGPRYLSRDMSRLKTVSFTLPEGSWWN